VADGVATILLNRPQVMNALDAGMIVQLREAAERAEGILAKFDWGISPDTPKEVLTQIQAFRDGKPSDREAAILKLADGGPAGHHALHVGQPGSVPGIDT